MRVILKCQQYVNSMLYQSETKTEIRTTTPPSTPTAAAVAAALTTRQRKRALHTNLDITNWNQKPNLNWARARVCVCIYVFFFCVRSFSFVWVVYFSLRFYSQFGFSQFASWNCNRLSFRMPKLEFKHNETKRNKRNKSKQCCLH